MSQCIVCNKVKGKRKCQKRDNEFICPPCCAKTRNQECGDCVFIPSEKISFPEKKKNKGLDKFIASIDENLDTKVDLILQQAERGQIAGCETKMRTLFEKYPNYHSTNYGMGVIYLLKKNEEMALPYFDRAVKILPIFAEAWFNKAMIHKDRHELYEMITSLRKAVEFSDDEDSNTKLANNILIQFEKTILKEYEVDLDEYLEMIEIYNGAFDFLKNHKFNNAIEGFKKVVERMPNHYQSWGNMGLCHGYLGDVKTAIECCQQAIKIYPRYEPAIINIESLKKLKEGEKLVINALEVNFKG
jgi:tetratricopeptide (TPR) repeat protein